MEMLTPDALQRAAALAGDGKAVKVTIGSKSSAAMRQANVLRSTIREDPFERRGYTSGNA
jgi:hypothetical protein